MSTLKVLIADDELLARQRLTRLLNAMPDVELVGECRDGDEVLRCLHEQDVDVLLLDIQMPGLNGLETKAFIGEDGPFVIFATAHPEHAVAAFDVGAVDYVLKPIEAARLAQALDRARRSRSTDSSQSFKTTRLAVETRGGVRLLDPTEISHATFDGQLVTIHLGPEAILTDLSLQELERRLPSDRFERVHRRAILNLMRVERLEPQPTGGYVAYTEGGGMVEVARQAARRLRRQLGLA